MAIYDHTLNAMKVMYKSAPSTIRKAYDDVKSVNVLRAAGQELRAAATGGRGAMPYLGAGAGAGYGAFDSWSHPREGGARHAARIAAGAAGGFLGGIGARHLMSGGRAAGRALKPLGAAMREDYQAWRGAARAAADGS